MPTPINVGQELAPLKKGSTQSTCIMVVRVSDSIQNRRFEFTLHGDAQESATAKAVALKARLLREGIDDVCDEVQNGKPVKVLTTYAISAIQSITIYGVDDTVKSTADSLPQNE